jgi:hypothetical protein
VKNVKKGIQEELSESDTTTPKQNYYYAPSPVHVSAVALIDPETGYVLSLSLSLSPASFVLFDVMTKDDDFSPVSLSLTPFLLSS